MCLQFPYASEMLSVRDYRPYGVVFFFASSSTSSLGSLPLSSLLYPFVSNIYVCVCMYIAMVTGIEIISVVYFCFLQKKKGKGREGGELDYFWH